MADTTKHRRKFTPEYRREAAHLVIDTGRPVKDVADEIAITQQLLGRWVRQEREALQPAGAVTEAERTELLRLRAENAQLRMDNEFLGKAAAYFASKNVSRTASR